MNPFVVFNISGIEGIAVNGECQVFPVEEHVNIVSIEILQDDLSIVGVKILFASDTIISSSIMDSARQTVELFIANIIGHLDVVVTKFAIQTGDIYNPNEQPRESPFVINDMILAVDTVSLIAQHPIQRYEGLFLNLPIGSEKRDRFTVFGSIMKIENIAIRYLMQYEFLVSLVSPNRKQKEVTDYIQKLYSQRQRTVIQWGIWKKKDESRTRAT